MPLEQRQRKENKNKTLMDINKLTSRVVPVTLRNAKNVPRNAAMSSGSVVGEGKRRRERYITKPARTAGSTSRSASRLARTPRSPIPPISSCYCR